MNKTKRNSITESDNKTMRKLFEKYFNNFDYNLEFHEYEYSTIDMCATAKTKTITATYDIEIKSREIDIRKYNDCFMEVAKCNELFSSEYSNERKIYAVIYPKNNEVLIWNVGDIDEIEQYYDKKWCKEETCTHEVTYMLKDVYMLPLNLAKKFELNCNHFNCYANN